MVSGASLAAEWTNSKEIALGSVYTDNVFLTDTDTESSWVALVTPAVSLRGDGRNLSLNMAYAPQYLNYLSGAADDKFYNRLQAGANFRIVPEKFFVDARATAGQAFINVFGPSGGDLINPTGNIQTVYTYSIAPTYRNRFGNDASINARYENVGVFYTDEGDDSVANVFDIGVRSGPSFGKTDWGAFLKNDYVNYQRGASQRLTNLGVSGGYEFSRRWRIDAVAGYEDNDISAVNPDTSGLRWEVSGSWTPNVRTALGVGIGRRFFGWTPSLVFSHRSKRSRWTASYKRGLSSAATEQREVDVFALEDADGEPNLDPITGEPGNIPPGLAPPSSSSFVNNTFRTTYTLQTRRSKVGANVAYILRQYEDSSRDYSTSWATVFWDRRLSAATNANLSLGWFWNKDEGSVEDSFNTEFTDWTLKAGITRKLTKRTEVGAWYSLRNRDSSQGSDDYSENRINFAIRTVWRN